MKLGTRYKLKKRNTIKSKIFEDGVILTNYGTTVIFLIYCLFGAIGKPKPGCNSYFFINNDLFFQAKAENRIQKSLTPPSFYHFIVLSFYHFIISSFYRFEKRYYFCINMLTFCKEVPDISKIYGVLAIKSIFSVSRLLRTKFQISSITLLCFRRGGKGVVLTPGTNLELKHGSRLFFVSWASKNNTFIFILVLGTYINPGAQRTCAQNWCTNVKICLN